MHRSFLKLVSAITVFPSHPLRRRLLVPTLIFGALFCTYSIYWLFAADSYSVAVLALLLLPVLLYFLVTRLSEPCPPLLFQYRNYVVALSTLCIIFTFVIPPLTSPDEDHHFAASYWLANCITGSSSLKDTGTLPMRPEDSNLLFRDYSWFIEAASYEAIFENASLFAQSTEMVDVDTSNTYYFSIGGDYAFLKIPSVLGIIIARFLHLGAYPLFYLGRLLSCAFFIICSLFAVSRTPFGKGAFAAVSLLPMTLSLAASYSYDCGIISLSLVFLALVLKAIFDKDRLGIFDLSILAVAAVLLAPCKLVYCFEIILVAAIPCHQFSSRTSCRAYKIAIAAGSLFAIIALRFPAIISLIKMNDGTVALSSTTEASHYSLSYIASNPINTVAIFIRTLIEKGDFYIKTAIGSYLGRIQIQIEMPLYLLLSYILCAMHSITIDSANSTVISNKWRVVFGLISLFVLFAVMISMLFAWTPLGSKVIEGVQGRYILPVLPLLLLSLQRRNSRNLGNSFSDAYTGFFIINSFFVVQFLARALCLT